VEHTGKRRRDHRRSAHGVDVSTVEPEIEGVGRHDYGHAVMDVGNVTARLCGDDGGGLHLLATPAHPAFPQPRTGDRTTVFPTDHVWPPPAAPLQPFVEAVRRDEAAPPLHGVAERRLFIHRIAARIDEQRKRARVLYPGRDEPPTHQGEVPFVLEEPYDRYGLCWRDVVTGREIRLLRIAEERPDRLRRADDQVASAHGKLRLRAKPII